VADDIVSLIDDGLVLPEVGSWCIEKYRFFRHYDDMFARSMKGKWRTLYIDLFAGSGYAKIRGTDRIVFGSPLIALSIPALFSDYVFCDSDLKCLAALRDRVERHKPGINASFVPGDCNVEIDRIIKAASGRFGLGNTITFCVVDPFGADFRFETVSKLSASCGRIDFLVLLALSMDIKRNWQLYLDAENHTIDELLGHERWRARAETSVHSPAEFSRLVAGEFCDSMEALGYIRPPTETWKGFKTSERGLPLYHLMFFSKHELGHRFWNEVMKGASNQKQLDLRL